MFFCNCVVFCDSENVSHVFPFAFVVILESYFTVFHVISVVQDFPDVFDTFRSFGSNIPNCKFEHFWTLYKINQIYNNDDLAMAFLDSSYNNLLDKSKRYTNKQERQMYLNNDKFNQHIKEEWEKVK